MKRIAFLTPEFASYGAPAGGLANYLRRMCALLSKAGWQPEVFVTSGIDRSEADERFGFLIHHVAATPLAELEWRYRLLDLVSNRLFPIRLPSRARLAYSLFRALMKRHQQKPFDVVQTSNFGLTGLFLDGKYSFRHVVRCSQSAGLCAQFQRGSMAESIRGGFSTFDHLFERMAENSIFESADVVYAPARRTCEYYRSQGYPVKLLYPPFFLEKVLRDHSIVPPGKRYFLFAGKLDKVKGADILGKAVPQLLEVCPDAHVIFARARERRNSAAQHWASA